MNIHEQLPSQCGRFLKFTHGPGYLPQVITAIRERYLFVRAPLSVEEMLPSQPEKGLNFSHGKYEVNPSTSIVIDNFRIYPLGLWAEAKAPTEDIDFFLTDFLDWATRTLGIRAEATRPNGYLSRLDIRYEQPVLRVPGLSPIANAISKTLEGYGMQLPPFEGGSIWLSYDTTKVVPPMGVANFRIERKVGVEYASNLYFSEAPLQTRDHVTLLGQIEQTLKELR
jgi:hypothetical protein